MQALDSYMETMDPNRKLIVITYVGVWVKVLLPRVNLLHAEDARIQHCLHVNAFARSLLMGNLG